MGCLRAQLFTWRRLAREGHLIEAATDVTFAQAVTGPAWVYVQDDRLFGGMIHRQQYFSIREIGPAITVSATSTDPQEFLQAE